MKEPDIILAIKPVIKAFNQLSIPYYIGGSIASSLYGIARASMDVDMIAALTYNHVASLVEYLKDGYYIDEQMIVDAISTASSFNLIHLETMMKIDVFIHKQDPYHESALTRRIQDLIVEGDPDSSYYFSSPEDVIISKLDWHKMGGQASDRQWLDILGVIKVQADSLDKDYLMRWSEAQGLSDLLKQAFSDAGIKI
jgi:hypothetical protein